MLRSQLALVLLLAAGFALPSRAPDPARADADGPVSYVLLARSRTLPSAIESADVRYVGARRIAVQVTAGELARLESLGWDYEVLFRDVDPDRAALLPVFRRDGTPGPTDDVRSYDPAGRVGFVLFPEGSVPKGWVPLEPGGGLEEETRPVRTAPIERDRVPVTLARETGDRVSADSLMAVVRRLSFNDTLMARRTRFAKRPETDRKTIPYLVDLFSRYLEPAGDSAYVEVREFTYHCELCDDDSTYTMENVVAGIRGTNPGLGKIVIGAHLDATAHFTEYPSEPGRQWEWRTEPAPGADDNGSGTASVLETARVLADRTFEFDLEFVAWDAEEILATSPFQLSGKQPVPFRSSGQVGDGRWGSKAYLAAEQAAGNDILAVFNLDMVGYPTPGRGRGVDLLTNLQSWWMTELYRETLEEVFPEVALDVRTIWPAPDYSDHAVFWDRAGPNPPIPAIALVEDWALPYPAYHTVADTAGHIDPAQFSDVVRILAGSIARLATPPSGQKGFDLSLGEGDLRGLRPGTVFPLPGNTVDVGESADLLVRARNISKSYGTSGDSFDLVLEEEKGSGFREIARWTIAGPFSFGDVWERRHTGWTARSGDEGEKYFRARILSGALPDTSGANNEVLGSVRVLGAGGARVKVHFAAPNPCPGPFSELAFHYQLTADSDVEILVFNLEGEEVASFRARAGESGGSLGANRVEGSRFDLEGRPPGSGLYLYRIALSGFGSGAEKEVGKFALVH
jgi:hypothetical protein